MSKVACKMRLAGPVVLVLVGIAGCGDSARTTAVVSVGRNVITEATLAHWLPVVAIRDYELIPRRPVPKWVVPDPPEYTACISHLKATVGKGAESLAKPMTVKFKSQCEQRYAALRRQVLGFLISGEWLIGEGEARGLTATDAEVRQRAERVNRNEFANRAELEKYAAFSGETSEDQRFRSEVKVFTEKMERQFMTMKGLSTQQRQHALLRFVKELPNRWVARTNCSPGYVVPNCRQYKGPIAPQIIL